MPEMGKFLQVCRTLEHEVLEEMGEPGAPLRLRPDADVVHDGDADHRGRRVGGKHDSQAVVQGEPLK